MSRLTLLTWVAALAAAAYPTWDTWRPPPVSESGEIIYGCVGMFSGYADISPFEVLRGDLATMTELATTWAVPVLVVLATLGRWHSAAAGRRAAALLTLIAFVRPLTPLYAGDSPCSGELPLFSLDWFEAVAGGWGLWELALLTAALLVLLATHALGPAEERAEEPTIAAPYTPAWHRGQGWRWGLGLLIGYLIVAILLTLAARLTWNWLLIPRSGLLHWLGLERVLYEPVRLLFYPALILCILPIRRFVLAREVPR